MSARSGHYRADIVWSDSGLTVSATLLESDPVLGVQLGFCKDTELRFFFQSIQVTSLREVSVQLPKSLGLTISSKEQW